MKIRVFHAEYGCDTGCCGHIVELEDGRHSFEFEHPYKNEDSQEWALSLARDIIERYWPECINTIDWDTFEYIVKDC